MKVIKYFLFTTLLSLSTFFISCNFEMHDFEKPTFPVYEGKVNVESNDTGVHISVDLEEENKYDQVTLYRVVKNQVVQLAQAKPVEEEYHYLFEGIPTGQIVYQVVNGVKSDTIASSRTNYLSGEINFDLYYLEPDTDYSFILFLHETEGKYNDVVTGQYGKVREIPDNPHKSEHGTNEYGYNYEFSVKTSSKLKPFSLLKATYDGTEDFYTFEKIDLTDSTIPYSITEKTDASFDAKITYTREDSSFSIDYDEEKQSTKSIVQKIDGFQFNKEYVPSLIESTISYKTEFSQDYPETIDETVPEETRIAYYTELYNQLEYTYTNLFTDGTNIPKITILDSRVVPVAMATDEGNKISFVIPNDTDSIYIYRASDSFQVGCMYGKFVAGKEYSFTDFYAAPGKDVEYYLTWDSYKSQNVSVTTSSELKYMPNPLEGTYDSKTYDLVITNNPFENKLPENYHGTIKIKYYLQVGWSDGEIVQEISEADTFNLEWDLRHLGENPKLKGKSIPITDSAEVTARGEVADIKYEHYGKLENLDVSKLPQKIKIPDFINGSDNSEENQNKAEEWYEEYVKPYKINNEISEEENQNTYIRSEEVDGGVKIELYVPQTVEVIYIWRGRLIDYDGGSAYLEDAHYYFKNSPNGELTLYDYNVKADEKYSYQLQIPNIYKYKYECEQSVTKTSPYYLNSYPTIQDGKIQGNLSWNNLPEGYTDLDSYDLSNVYTESCIYNPYNGYPYYIKGTVVPNPQKIEYLYTDINTDVIYFEDEYGNKTPIVSNTQDTSQTYCFEKSYTVYDSGSTAFGDWSNSTSTYATIELKKGKYILSNVENYGIGDSQGIWLYNNPLYNTKEVYSFIYE